MLKTNKTHSEIKIGQIRNNLKFQTSFQCVDLNHSSLLNCSIHFLNEVQTRILKHRLRFTAVFVFVFKTTTVSNLCVCFQDHNIIISLYVLICLNFLKGSLEFFRRKLRLKDFLFLFLLLFFSRKLFYWSKQFTISRAFSVKYMFKKNHVILRMIFRETLRTQVCFLKHFLNHGFTCQIFLILTL